MTLTMKKLFALLLLTASLAAQADAPVYGVELQGFDYPVPVLQFSFKSQGQPMHMAYLDYQPAKPNGHGGVVTRQEFLCRYLARHSRDAAASRLAGHRAGSNRFLQIREAGQLQL